jgi:hypothetical protein
MGKLIASAGHRVKRSRRSHHKTNAPRRISRSRDVIGGGEHTYPALVDDPGEAHVAGMNPLGVTRAVVVE